jgi:secretion/DNA translocation related TadE-like protein
MHPGFQGRPQSRRLADDQGAAAVWVLGCGAVLFVLALVIVIRSVAVLERHRVESAADFAALAGAARIGVSGDPCAAARRLAERNRATLQRCSVSLDAGGRSGTVVVRVLVHVTLPVVGARDVTASARAGRLVSPADPVADGLRAHGGPDPSPALPVTSMWRAFAVRNRSRVGVPRSGRRQRWRARGAFGFQAR